MSVGHCSEASGDRIAFSLTPVSPRLSKGKKAFRARVRTRGTFDTLDIAREMAGRGAMNDVPTCRYFLSLLHEIIAEKTLAGYRLKTEFFETGLSGDGESRFDLRHGLTGTRRQRPGLVDARPARPRWRSFALGLRFAGVQGLGVR